MLNRFKTTELRGVVFVLVAAWATAGCDGILSDEQDPHGPIYWATAINGVTVSPGVLTDTVWVEGSRADGNTTYLGIARLGIEPIGGGRYNQHFAEWGEVGGGAGLYELDGYMLNGTQLSLAPENPQGMSATGTLVGNRMELTAIYRQHTSEFPLTLVLVHSGEYGR